MKHILLLGTGGTIACKSGTYGLSPQIACDELLSYVPEARNICHVDAVQLLNIDSTEIHVEHWLKIADMIEKNYRAYDGFVVTHGTDTMAYTAAALAYLIQNSAKPVVLTGAQRPINTAFTDARNNLLDSLCFASCNQAHGVNIVFNGNVIAGTRGKKIRTKSFRAFYSINFPQIASIIDGKIRFYLQESMPEQDSICFFHQLNDRVALLKLTPGLTANVLDYMAAHFDAVVIEGFGVGGLPSVKPYDFLHAAERWIQRGKVIVMATQVTEEGSDMSRYEVGQRIKCEYDLLESFDMTIESVITKMMWILGQTSDIKEIERLFYTPVYHDLLPTK